MKVIDLDALVPPKVTIKFNGVEISVPPPTTFDFITLSTYAVDLNKVDGHDPDKLTKAINRVSEQLQKMIPDLAGHTFTIQQIDHLVAMFTRMSTSPEQKELDKRGITPAEGKKDQTD